MLGCGVARTVTGSSQGGPLGEAGPGSQSRSVNADELVVAGAADGLKIVWLPVRASESRRSGLLALAVVVNLTGLRSGAWWTESVTAGVATAALRGLKPVVPERFGTYLPA